MICMRRNSQALNYKHTKRQKAKAIAIAKKHAQLNNSLEVFDLIKSNLIISQQYASGQFYKREF